MTGRPSPPPRTLGLFVLGALCLAVLGAGLGVYLLEPALLKHAVDAAAGDGVADTFPVSRIVLIQRRLLILCGVWCGVGLVMLVLHRAIGRAWTLVRDDLHQAWRGLAQRPSLADRGRGVDLAVVLILTVGFIVLSVPQLDQPMRTDEAMSAMNFAARPAVVGLSSYRSPNNHILNSLLMRLAYLVLGNRPWALRLPAWFAGVAMIGLTALAGRALLGRGRGLIAAALVAGSAYLVDFATNARGYTLLACFMLAQLALLPAMVRRRPAAWAGFALLAALGLFTVPIMLFPLAIVSITLVAQLVQDPKHARRLLPCILVAGLGVVLLTFLLYSPALIVSGLTPVARPDIIQTSSEPTRLETFRRSGMLLGLAFEQWTFGWPAALRIAGVLLLGLGAVGMAIRGGIRRGLVLGLILGPPLVVGTINTVLPLWSHFFLFPFFVLLISEPLGAGLGWLRARRGSVLLPPALALVLAGAVALPLVLAPRPLRLPWHVGYFDAPAAADWLGPRLEPGVKFFATPTGAASLRYYLPRLQNHPQWEGPPTAQTRVVYLLLQKNPRNNQRLLRAMRDQPFTRVPQRHELPGSVILKYTRDPKPRAESPSPSPVDITTPSGGP